MPLYPTLNKSTLIPFIQLLLPGGANRSDSDCDLFPMGTL